MDLDEKGGVMFQFYWPWFALLLPLPYLVYKFFYRPPSSDLPRLLFPSINRLKKTFSSSINPPSLPDKHFLALLWLSWVFMIIALMRPEQVDHQIEMQTEGYDIMLAVDLSGSMNALDFSTTQKAVSRLDVTKEVVADFVRQRKGDRIGLITFGEHAYLYVPLTAYTDAVTTLLQDTVPGMAGQSTAIGDALGLAVATLRTRPEGSRVIILLTDGEDNASSVPPKEAARLAKEYGIRIYTIGVGKNGPVPFPSPFGGYQMVAVSIDEPLLQEIAQMTEGSYFRATDKDSLQQVYDKINTLEKSKAEEQTLLLREPLFYYPLSMALLALLLLALLPLTRSFHYAN